MNRSRLLVAVTALCCAAVLAGCGTSGSARRGGGYYQNDGPGSNPPDIDSIPDAVPRIETHSKSTSKPYVVFGKRYVPLSDEQPFRQVGTASWYGRQFHGNKTANGETYDMYAMTAAHPTLPIPSYARVTSARSGRSIIVRVNDRGPFHSTRIMDLSYVAAAKLGLIGPGSGQVIVEAITNSDIARGAVPRVAGKAPPAVASASPPPPVAPAAVAIATPPDDALSILSEDPGSQTGTGKPESTRASAANGTAQPLPQATTQVAQATDRHDSLNTIYLQFGAFSTAENARSLALKLNQALTQSESGPVQVQSAGHLYKVQMGPYASRTEAVNAAWRIQQQTGTQPNLSVASRHEQDAGS